MKCVKTQLNASYLILIALTNLYTMYIEKKFK